jgi:enamine deaminase RidA (YjgF/YER057c/UK114 family)
MRAVSAEYLNPPTLSAPPGAMYSQAVRVRAGETLYISGQVARDQAGNLVGQGDVVAQYRQVWSNIGLALAAVGLRHEHLVKTTTYVVGEANIPPIRAVRKELAPAKAPTSTMLVVPALAIPGALVEIEAVAAFPEPSK